MWQGWLATLTERLEGETAVVLGADLQALMGLDPATNAILPHGLLAATPMARIREQVVDFLVDPHDTDGLVTLLRWVDREARAADSDKIRCFCLNAGFGRVLKQEGYSSVKSSLQFVVKVNAVSVPPDFYTRTDRWHIMLGDSDQDR